MYDIKINKTYVNIYVRFSFLCNFSDGWYHGIIKSNAQNWSRKLTESASNHMTPILFSKVMYKLDYYYTKTKNNILRVATFMYLS